MVLHLTVRLAWHDSCWTGKVCRRPSENIFCSGNYSLLSTRIQRRKIGNLEEQYSGKDASEIIERENYVPPCYWVINLLADKKLRVKHIHPFCDFTEEAKQGGIKPIEDTIEPYAILSWCFKFSFSRDGLLKYPRDLEDRLNHYLSYIVPGKSVVFFYLNYSNPVNGDRHRYLVVGAALVKDVKKPKQYEFDPTYYKKLENDFGGYFPPIEWSFQIVLDPDTIIIIPYQEYIKKLEEVKDENVKRKIERMIDEIIVEVDKQTLIPHFKYVSMHISTDKALYILYKILNSLNRINEHGIVEQSLIETYVKRAKELIKHLWRLRGEHSSLGKLLIALGVNRGIFSISPGKEKSLHNLGYKKYKEIEEKIRKFLGQYGERLIEIIKTRDLNGLENLLNNIHPDSTMDSYCISLLREILHLAKSRGKIYFKLLELLSRLDLTYIQILNIIRAVENKQMNVRDIVDNPYSLIYSYIPQYELQEREWFVEFMDFNIDLYLLDIPLIPDPDYSELLWLSLPKALDRLIAVIYETLYNKAVFDGVTAVREEDLIEAINENQVLKLYHGTMPEISKADIEDIMVNRREALSNIIHCVVDPIEGRIFQLKHIREIERTIEDFIKKMLKKSFLVSSSNINYHIESVFKSLCEKMSCLNISKNQKEDFLSTQKDIYYKAVKHGLLVITGGAGTGKTETIVNLVDLYSRIGRKPILIVTPTGKSSLVIEERLKSRGLLRNVDMVSTIHRLLYSYHFEKFLGLRGEYIQLVDLIDKTFNDIRFFSVFKNYIAKNSGLKINPRVLIIDEASMVDEVLLALLLSIVNIHNLEHLIIVGDSNQLPPIGFGKPFVDIIDFLNEKHGELVITLETPIRFPVKTGIWAFSQAFTSTDNPIDDPKNYVDDTLKIECFIDKEDLKGMVKNILKEILDKSNTVSIDEYGLLELFNNILGFGSADGPQLDKIQILTPTRYGELGSEYINKILILDSKNIQDYNYVKIINERNRYVNLKSYGRILLIPNGALGYWFREKAKFMETSEFLKRLWDYKGLAIKYLSKTRNKFEKRKYYGLIKHLQNDIDRIYELLKDIVYEIKGRYKEGDSYISPGYAVTVHKAQGSDFDYVIFILPRISSFITKELVYTALTRAKKKLYLLLNANLKDNVVPILQQIKMLSELDRRQTLLFNYRRFSGRIYSLKLKDGRTIYTRSKIEYMIAKTLDGLGIEFEYEPRDLEEHGIIPDFKVVMNGKVFYIEHLGLLDKEIYRGRWETKRRIYEKLGLLGHVITTSEPKEGNINIEYIIKKIIDDIKSGKLMETKTGFPSKHHYILTKL